MSERFYKGQLVTTVSAYGSTSGYLVDGASGYRLQTIVLSDGSMFRTDGYLYPNIVDSNGKPAIIPQHKLFQMA